MHLGTVLVISIKLPLDQTILLQHDFIDWSEFSRLHTLLSIDDCDVMRRSKRHPYTEYPQRPIF